MAAAGKGTTSPLEWSTIYVGDLHPEVNEAILVEKFSSIGPVAAVHVCRDSITQRSMGYAYVNYYSQLDATQAIEKLNYTPIRGRCCRIMWNNKERPFYKNPDANIFVGNLDLELDSRALYETFGIFGHIISCKVASSPDGTSKGYGFVQYESEDAAKQAIERLNGVVLGGKAIFVGPFKQRNAQKEAEDGDERSLYVRNIPIEWDDVQVKELFSTYGAVESCLIMSQGKGSKRYGFINFADLASAQKAVAALHGKDMRTDEERAIAEAAEVAEAAKKEVEAEEDSSKPIVGEEAILAKPDENDDRENDDEKGADKVPPYCLWVRPAKGRMEQERRPKERKEIAPETLEGVRLIVRSLPADTDDEKLRSLFEPFGKVTDVKAVQDREAGECRGYGFVRLSTMDEASAAVKELHMKEIAANQPPLNVGLASKGDRKGKGRDGKGFNSMGKSGKGFKGPAPFDMLRPHEMLNPYGPGMGMYPGGMRPPMGWPPMVMPGWRPVPYAPAGAPGVPGPRPGMPMTGMPISTGVMPGMQGAGVRPPLTEEALAPLPANIRKQMLGEHLFPLVQKIEPAMASKITGMLLESLDSELLSLLKDESALAKKVAEAKLVLLR
mmetsp:Transcript_5289/g.12738  ORF Transcript_5289/g.12738 Transcript_5289/m.12738 type:complete len:612 (-) Transcript_5289:144-1979(-)